MVQKIAYLTIDDAPSADMAQKVDFLATRGIPALFFCRGDLMEARPRMVVEAIRRGFVIGNHSYDHPHFSDLTVEAAREQIRRTDAIVERLYAEAGTARPGKVFRFPYGDKGGLRGSQVLEPYSPEGAARKGAIQSYLRELGYAQPPFEGISYRYYREAGLLEDVDWYWTYDVLEWSVHVPEHRLYGIYSLEKVLARMDEEAPEGGRGLNDRASEEIILTHDHEESTPIFTAIIERLLAKGLTFKAPPL